MSRLTFGNDYKDLSTKTEFQFEFTCDRCGRAWQSAVTPYSPPQTDKKGAENIATPAIGIAAYVEKKVEDAAYETGRSYALEQAVEQAQKFFQQCRHCRQWFCGECFDYSYVMCVNCRPT
jgi:hypothetical protein